MFWVAKTDSELFMNLMDVVPNPMYLRSFDGICVACNKALEKYLGCSRENLLQQNIEDMIYGEEDLDFSRGMLDEVLRLHPCVQSFDVSLVQDGKQVHLGVFREVLTIPSRQESYILTILVDVTPHRKNEQILQKSLGILHGVLQSSYSGILALQKKNENPEHIQKKFDVVADNLRFRTLFDLPLEEEISVSLLRNLQEGLGLGEIDWFSESSLSDPSMRETILYLPNGKILEQQSLPFFSRGEISGRIWNYRDVTEQCKAQLLLQESNEKNQALWFQSSDGIFVLDPIDLHVQDGNTKIAELLQYTLDEFMALLLPDFLELETFDLEEGIRKVQQCGHCYLGQWKLRCKNGERLLGEVSASLISFHEKQVLLFNIRDITDRIRQENQILLDVQLAAKVQRQFLPPFLHTEDMIVKGVFFPSHGVSGDIYHYQWNPEEKRLSGFLVDVSGHGLATALHTSLVLTLGKAALERPETLAKRVGWLNSQLVDWFTDGKFAAAIFFEADLQDGCLRTVSAGMGHYLCVGQTGLETCKESGFFLGMFDQVQYTEIVTFLYPNDSYYFLSDGISDLLDNPLLLSKFEDDYDKNLALIGELAGRSERHDDSSAVCIHFRHIGMAVENRLRAVLIVPAEKKYLQQLDDFLEDKMYEWNILCEEGMLFAAREAYLNVVQLAEKKVVLNEMATIEMHIHYFDGILEIQVLDEGPGLPEDWRETVHTQEKKDSSITACSGRGLLFITCFFEEVESKQRHDGRHVLKMRRRIGNEKSTQ